MYSAIGHPEGTSEHYKLVDKHGFEYQKLLGEMMYAYITCLPNIGYAIISLSKFSNSPADYHFWLMKHVMKYLQKTNRGSFTT
mmetsp:Transcript_17708/g.26865  ORF Transcript_17708/g.26865 Transcript_17708/m.26865 type:complete len:83 (-) Transcript_17708:648-896(-)